MEFEEAVRRKLLGKTEPEEKPKAKPRRRGVEQDESSSCVDCSLAEQELPARFYGIEHWAPSELRFL